MGSVSALRPRRKHFDRAVKRRREIEAHAKFVGAADTDDLNRWLIAWVWHNWQSKDQVNAVIECARRMGRKGMTTTEASEIIEEASTTRKHWSADNLARFLGLTWEQRECLGITTIGSVNVGKRARKELRKRYWRIYHERRRRIRGARSRQEYETSSLAARARAEGVSRMTIYRRKAAEQTKKVSHVTGASSAVFLSTGDRPVTLERKGTSKGVAAPLKQVPLQGAATFAVDAHESLPVELRLLALGLPIIPRKNFGVAA